MASVNPNDRKGWNKPGPAHIPAPSFWPPGLALGIVLLVWGPALEYVVWWVLVAAGGLLIVFSLGGWILDIRNELRSRDE